MIFFLSFFLVIATAVEREKKILFIGISGIQNDCISETLTPTILSQDRSGLSNKHTSVYPCIKENNIATMFCGVLTGKHGVTNSRYLFSDIEGFPPIFNDLSDKDDDSKTVEVISNSWNNLEMLFKKSVNSSKFLRSDEMVMKEAIKVLRKKERIVDILSLFFGSPDFVGQRRGGYDCQNNNNYRKSISTLDNSIEKILQNINERELNSKMDMNREEEEWLVIITSSNGGKYGSNFYRNEETCSRFLIISKPISTFTQTSEHLFSNNTTSEMKSLFPNIVSWLIYDFFGFEILDYFDPFLLIDGKIEEEENIFSDDEMMNYEWIIFPWNDEIIRWIFQFSGCFFIILFLNSIFFVYCISSFEKRKLVEDFDSDSDDETKIDIIIEDDDDNGEDSDSDSSDDDDDDEIGWSSEKGSDSDDNEIKLIDFENVQFMEEMNSNEEMLKRFGQQRMMIDRDSNNEGFSSFDSYFSD